MKNNIKNRGKNNETVKKSGNDNVDNQKKPFNKRKYREQKYSNKFKVKQYNEKRNKAIIREFVKSQKKEEKVKPDIKTGDSESNEKPKYNYQIALNKHLKNKMDEKKEKREEYLKAKQEREEAFRKYKEKKLQAYKELSKKTKKGQPVMKGRMELLLRKIEEKVL